MLQRFVGSSCHREVPRRLFRLFTIAPSCFCDRPGHWARESLSPFSTHLTHKMLLVLRNTDGAFAYFGGPKIVATLRNCYSWDCRKPVTSLTRTSEGGACFKSPCFPHGWGL